MKHTNKRMAARVVLGLALMAYVAAGQTGSAPHQQSPATNRDARMQWWREARFGMFIHWGLYSNLGGKWKGKAVTGTVCTVQEKMKIPADEYALLKNDWDPVKYDPEAWVRLARDAGMKYIVLVAKHHDGFCLWDSAQTDFDVGSTPWKKDLIKPLAEACRKHGIKLCLYYSIIDWHNPDFGGNMEAYVPWMKAQLKELLTNYGEIGALWFDGDWETCWTHERAVDLDDFLCRLQPSIIINNRIDVGRTVLKDFKQLKRGNMPGLTREGDFRGDFGTPEDYARRGVLAWNLIPSRGVPGVDWEACACAQVGMWEYNSNQPDWVPSESLLRDYLIDIVSKGGNLLLNFGPTGTGEFPAPAVERLQAIAAWMKVNGEAIHGTRKSPFGSLPFDGRCTWKPAPAGSGQSGKLFLHLFRLPAKGLITLPMSNKMSKAYLLAKPDTALKVDGQTVTVPSPLDDPIATVVVVEIAGEPDVIVETAPGKKGK